MNTVTQTDTRTEYIEGLRALADLLETRGLTGRSDGDNEFSPFNVHVDTKAEAAAWARALTDVTKAPATSVESLLIDGRAGALHVRVWVDRAEVCERVVTGTREVTRTVPAPDAPMVEVTETVEDVEWVCSPLLAEDRESEAVAS